MSPVTSTVDRLRFQADRARYRAGHEVAAAFLFLFTRAIHLAMNPRAHRPTLRAALELQRRFEALLARDLANVEGGYYPRDLLFATPLARYTLQIPEALYEMPRLIRRSHVGDLAVEPPPEAATAAAYPPYYLRPFHWQPNGWFSDRSARLYDLAVEILFSGTADVMRRMVIPPVKDALRGREEARVLDLCCGTGRFLAMLHAAAPAARLYGVDLSPFCLAEARRNLAAAPTANLLAENAEELPFDDGRFAAVTCIFSFHEMPRDARRRVTREARRVLEPGGVFCLLDADQAAPGEGISDFLRAFPELYHEPYFRGYQRDDLATLLEECGFGVVRAEVHCVSRLVAGRKPS